MYRCGGLEGVAVVVVEVVEGPPVVVGVAIVLRRQGEEGETRRSGRAKVCRRILECKSPSEPDWSAGMPRSPSNLVSSRSAPSSRAVDRRRTAPRSLKLRNAALLRRETVRRSERERGTETMHGVEGGKSEQIERGYTRSAPKIGAERRETREQASEGSAEERRERGRASKPVVYADAFLSCSCLHSTNESIVEGPVRARSQRRARGGLV